VEQIYAARPRNIGWQLSSQADFAAIIALTGFVVQLVGFSGLRWNVAVPHLGATIVLAIIRSWLRRGLAEVPPSITFHSGEAPMRSWQLALAPHGLTDLCARFVPDPRASLVLTEELGKHARCASYDPEYDISDLASLYHTADNIWRNNIFRNVSEDSVDFSGEEDCEEVGERLQQAMCKVLGALSTSGETFAWNVGAELIRHDHLKRSSKLYLDPRKDYEDRWKDRGTVRVQYEIPFQRNSTSSERIAASCQVKALHALYHYSQRFEEGVSRKEEIGRYRRDPVVGTPLETINGERPDPLGEWMPRCSRRALQTRNLAQERWT
jgi:hypothetical protein